MTDLAWLRPAPHVYFIRHALRWLLGLFLVFTGISHLTWARVEFLRKSLPGCR